MSELQTPQALSMTGVVVETFEREGIPIAKILIRPLHMEVPLEAVRGTHLGETVRLYVTCSVKSVDQGPNFDEDLLNVHLL